MKNLKLIRYGAWAAVAALALSAAWIVGLQVLRVQENPQLANPLPKIGGPFELVNGNGKTVTEADFAGKPSLLYFGFTFCPDVCPTTLADMQGWITDLGPDAEKLNYAFITVDPERDTPELMRDYVAAFDDRIQALSGSRAQIDSILSAYRVYARKVPLDGGGYTMDHSAMVYVMDANNEITGTIAYGESHENAMKKLRRYIANNKSSST
ncbi:MAG: SCO family protein [Rhodobacteraceae bacterium]|nr:SCO family protein [Paracoccaceae bacterium]